MAIVSGREKPLPPMGVLAILAVQILRPTYSTSSRHGGQAKAGSDAPLAQPHRDEAGSDYVARQSGMGTSHSSTSKPLSVSHTMLSLKEQSLSKAPAGENSDWQGDNH